MGYRDAGPRADEGGLPPVQICGPCGFGAPARAARCPSCESDLASHRRQAPQTGSLVWCAVRATFQCRACAFHSPLDGIELDQGIHCAQCGAFQKFDVGGWEPLLAQMHAVADLAGPTPEGRFPSPRIWIGDINPYKSLGIDGDFASAGGGEGGGGGALPEVQIARGHPTCAACEQPLDVAIRAGGCETRCRGCGVTATYDVPSAAARQAPALRGIVASEQRTDQKCVKLTQQAGGGTVALSCPGCGAPLREVRLGSVRCNHCNTQAFVPARARPREDGTLLTATPFFLVFQGPSAERARLETPRVAEEGAALALGKAKGIFVRGLSPLKGVELPEKKQGVDFRQLATTLGLAGVALAIGCGVVILSVLFELDVGF